MSNPFKQGSAFFPFRWYILFTLLITGTLVYANLSGWRIFGSTGQEQWTASGPGSHK
ncbi:MAG TPA: hypothetical protein VEY10_00755 [Flavisolibacter sp.]|nr:hypothetical protein [Flavisolibacter sp.]